MGVYKRNGIWYFRTWLAGKEIRRSVGKSKRQAELALARVRADIAEGKFLDPLKGNKIRYAQLLDRYLKEHSAVTKGPVSLREDQYLAKELKQVFGDMFIKDVTPDRVSSYVEVMRASGRASSTINHRIGMLKHSLTLAKRWNYIRNNPLDEVKRLREPTGRLRYLQPGEFQRLIEELPAHLKPIVTLAAHTGMRLDEILSLTWPQVDLRQRVITLTRTKNREIRGVPMNSRVMEIFRILSRERMRHVRNSQYVFNNPLTGHRWENIARAFNSAVKRAGIENFRFHDLRHTAASWMVMSGVDLLTVAEILGHKDTRMTRRYSHLSPMHRLEAVSRLENILTTEGENPQTAQS